MNEKVKFPEDFNTCVKFHGHVCPGLAIGYAAVNAGKNMLGLDRAEDEELVAIVENDSCAVDAVQVLLGCTFGKGNLIFRDWGKQVFSFMSRNSGRGVRVALGDRPIPGWEKRKELRKKIDSGAADQSDLDAFEELKATAALEIVTADPRELFKVEELEGPLPPMAQVVCVTPCEKCGEQTVESRMVEMNSVRVCKGCAAKMEAEA